MKMNLARCVFSIRGGKLLCFLVSNKGIKPNPKKIQAILDITPPQKIKDVQLLIRTLFTLNIFKSR